LEVLLEAGKYIVVPITTGALMVKSKEFNGKPRCELIERETG